MLTSRAMDEFQSLVKTIKDLLGPNGCPWDRKQTLLSMRADLIEEAYEVVEAIDLNNNRDIEEELGDLFFNVVFLCELAEKEKQILMENVLKQISSKLIRRHPHVFGEVKVQNAEEVLIHWEKIKRSEEGKQHRKSALDGIPKNLPTLARAYKVMKKMNQAGFVPVYSEDPNFEDEKGLGAYLAFIVGKAAEKGLDAEHALRQFITESEVQFRKSE